MDSFVFIPRELLNFIQGDRCGKSVTDVVVYKNKLQLIMGHIFGMLKDDIKAPGYGFSSSKRKIQAASL